MTVRNKIRSRYEMIVVVLRRHALTDTGEQKLAFAVIEQAVNDISSFVISGYLDYEPHSAIAFLEGGCESYADGIGLDRSYILKMVNTPLPGAPFGIIDAARNRLISGDCWRKKPQRKKKEPDCAAA